MKGNNNSKSKGIISNRGFDSVNTKRNFEQF